MKMEIPSHPGRWENVFRSNLYLRLAESTKKKIFCEKSGFIKNFKKVVVKNWYTEPPGGPV